MELSPSSTAVSGGIMCVQHTQVMAALSCHRCGLPMCDLCAFEMNGQWLCPNCIAQGVVLAPSYARVQYGHAVQPAMHYTAPLPPGARCVQHQNVAATQLCKVCGAYMCSTCDFELPGGVHVCPACASAPKTNLSPRRKRLMIGAYVTASIATLGLGVLFSGVLSQIGDRAEVAGLALLLMGMIVVPSIMGTAMGFSAMDRRLPTPMALWIATVWNGIILACFGLKFIFNVILR